MLGVGSSAPETSNGSLKEVRGEVGRPTWTSPAARTSTSLKGLKSIGRKKHVTMYATEKNL